MKVAILGTGRMGRNVIGHLQECPEVTEIIACDINRESLEKISEQNKVRCTESLDEILNDPRIPLVFVTASNMAHKPLSIAAMKAGKAVMCEKPMALNLEDAAGMVEEADKNGVFFQVGFELRYSRLYSTVREWIDGGKLGEIRNIQCTYICSEFWRRHSWRTKLAGGGSMFGEKLSHYIDLPRWWTGSPIRAVYAAASPNIVSYFEVRDNYHATFRFESGAVSHLTFMMPFASTSKGDPLQDQIEQRKDDGHELRFLIMGTQGAAETNVFRRQIKRWEYSEAEDGFESELVENRTWKPEEDHRYFHNTRDQTHDIVRRVRDGLPPMTPAKDSLETMKACMAADLSADRGSEVRINELREATF